MCCGVVITSGAGTSVSSPMLRAIWRIQPRQICSCSRMLRWCGSQITPALAAAERDVDDGALPRHPHGQGAHGIDRLLRVEADAALGRAARVVVLHAEALENLDVPIVHADGDEELELALRVAQQVARALVEIEQVRDLVELSLRHLERVEALRRHAMNDSRKMSEKAEQSYCVRMRRQVKTAAIGAEHAIPCISFALLGSAVLVCTAAGRTRRPDPRQRPHLHGRCRPSLGRSDRDPRVADRCYRHQRRRAGLHGGRTRTIDLKGAFVSPGFNDAHVHIDSTGSVARRRQPARRPRAQGVHAECVKAAGTASQGQLDHPRRLGRVRTVERRQRRSGPSAAACRRATSRGTVYAVTGSGRRGHTQIIRSSCKRFDRSMYLANSLALKLAGITESHAQSAERRDPEGCQRAADRDPQGHRRRSRPQGHSAGSVRAAARAGPRRSEGSARGRRDDDAGPDECGAVARLPGVAAARRADVADHAAADARQRHAHAARSGSRAASATSGCASSATRRGSTASWAAAARCSSSPTRTIRRTRGCCATS